MSNRIKGKKTRKLNQFSLFYLRKIDLVYVWAVRSDLMILNTFNKVFYELHLRHLLS